MTPPKTSNDRIIKRISRKCKIILAQMFARGNCNSNKGGGVLMKRRFIYLLIIFFVGAWMITPTSSVYAQFSKDPKDLEAFADTVWIFGYGGSEAPLTTTMFSIGSEVQTTAEGYVQLSVNDPYSEAEYYEPGVLMVKNGETEDDQVIYSIVIDDTYLGRLLTFEVGKSGNILEGSMVKEYPDMGMESPPEPATGFKWASSICDKNSDGKLGLPEAIYYLKITSGIK